MPTRWSQSQSWSACSATAYSPPSMPKPSKMVIKKTSKSRPSRMLLLQKPNPLVNFCPRSKRWMFTVYEAINPPSKRTNIPRGKFLIKIFLSFRSLDPSLFKVLKIPRLLTSLGKTIKTISEIEEAVVIMAFAAQDFQAQLQLLGLIQPIFIFKTTVTVTGHQNKRTETWVKPFIKIISRRSILLTSALSSTSQKTSIGFGNLYIGD